MVLSSYAIIEAPSILGLFPNGVETLPAALLAAGLAERIDASCAGNVEPPHYDPQRDEATGLMNPKLDKTGAIAIAFVAALAKGLTTNGT